MASQFCPECGTVVPVHDGSCHLGHPVPTEASGADDTAPVEATDAGPDPDEPTPWVATVEDDDLAPRDPDPTAPPPPTTALGSASVPPSGTPNLSPSDLAEPADLGAWAGATEVSIGDPTDVGAASVAAADQGGAGADGPPEHAPEEAAVSEPTPPERDDEDTSLEDLAAMAAASGGYDDSDDDLSRLQDDIRGDLGGGPATASPEEYDLGGGAATASPEEYDLGGADDEFDLDSLEDAVADLEGDRPAPPPGDELAPKAPGPDAAPSPEQAIAELPRTPEDGGADPDAVSIRPDHDAPDPSDGTAAGSPLDPRNFTASGRKVASASSAGGSGGSGGGLLDRLKAIFNR